MTEKINWQKELLESEKFNDKFSKNLLEHGAKNFMQDIYLGYMYSRWRKIRGHLFALFKSYAPRCPQSR